MDRQRELVATLRRYITDQIFVAFGFGEHGWARRWFWPLFWPPAQLFSSMIARVDHDVKDLGVREAARRLVLKFVKNLEVYGAENIPPEGPVLVTSNHPGTFDSVAISASLAREDLKIVATGIPFLRVLPNLRDHLIYTPNIADINGRMQVVRESIHHLERGGAVLIFPTGSIDPDPDVLPGASEALGRWSPSIELFLRRVPQTKLIITIISGVLAASCMRNPLVKLQKLEWEQRRIAEFLQIMQQMFIPGSFGLAPRISFGEPLSVGELRQDEDQRDMLGAIIQRARYLLAIHRAMLTGSPAP